MKLILTFLLTLVISTCVFCQIPLGFMAGMNINTIKARNTGGRFNDPFKSEVSFHVGVFSKVKLTKNLHFVPEVQFIQKKSSTNDASNAPIEMSYIEVPLLLSYTAAKWVSIEAGPSFGLNIGSNLIDDLYDDNDFGGVGGVRFHLLKKWSFLARYYYGLSPIDEIFMNSGPGGQPPSQSIKMYNENLQFSVAYYLK